MNSTNRALNRAVLLVFALLLGAAGAVCLVLGIRPSWAEAPLAEAVRVIEAAFAGMQDAVIEVPGAGEVPIVLIAAFVAALVLAVALIAFVFARGRGGVHEVASERAVDGRTDVDRSVVDAVLAGALASRRDVLSSRTGVYSVKGARTVRLAVTVRRGASLADVITAAERAIKDWDSLLGSEIPILIHLTDRGWLARYRSTVRVR